MRRHLVILGFAVALTLSSAVALGLGPAGGIERPREVVSGGASESASGDVTLRGTLGQPVVGVVSDTGGDVTLGQGFWHGYAVQGGYRVYLPVAVRD